MSKFIDDLKSGNIMSFAYVECGKVNSGSFDIVYGISTIWAVSSNTVNDIESLEIKSILNGEVENYVNNYLETVFLLKELDDLWKI
jgi:hypothetical protein